MKLREASVNPQLNHDKGGGEDGSVRIADGEFRDWNVGEKRGTGRPPLFLTMETP
jgi:hypothetical protein